MKFTPLDPPRVFTTGRDHPIHISDCARIALSPDEQVTFVTESGAEYDVTRKGWGFYAAPSLNGRLLDHGLRAALGRSHVGKYYLFLVERGSEQAFQAYLAHERNALVRWLDNATDLAAIPEADTAARDVANLECMCASNRLTTVHMYFAPPPGEVRFAIPERGYRRELFRCSICGHFLSIHGLGDSFYQGEYVDGTYGDGAGMRSAFERITSLPPERSDNAGRVARILAYAGAHLDSGRTVLDVGSGLCVFLQRMKAAGWACTALDPDERAVAHARTCVGVDAVHADFMKVDPTDQFDLVSFNKVLEHVSDPIAMMAKSRGWLRPGGVVYLEVPDGEAAVADGFDREEFFIEHQHVFSLASVALMVGRAGFRINALERLREPSTKYTLRVFATPA